MWPEKDSPNTSSSEMPLPVVMCSTAEARLAQRALSKISGVNKGKMKAGTQISILSLLKHTGVKVVNSKVFVTNDKVLAFFKDLPSTIEWMQSYACCKVTLNYFLIQWVSQSHSVVSDSLRLHELWNSPGQNTGVGSLSLLQGIFQTQGSNPGLPHCRENLYHSWATREALWYTSPTYEPSNWQLSKMWMVCLHLESCKLVHVSGIRCHVRTSSTSRCAFVYCTV